MAKKVPVVVEVDPEVGVEIKPFASSIAKASKVEGLHPEMTVTATVTYNNGSVDGDATID
jgi:hypothetical protein